MPDDVLVLDALGKDFGAIVALDSLTFLGCARFPSGAPSRVSSPGSGSASARDGRVVAAFVAIVLAPLAEEIFFRGWLQSTIEGELPERRRWLAPLLAAFAFASLRTPMSFVPVLLLGLVTGWLYARTRSVVPGIAAHVVHVSVSIAARYALGS